MRHQRDTPPFAGRLTWLQSVWQWHFFVWVPSSMPCQKKGYFRYMSMWFHKDALDEEALQINNADLLCPDSSLLSPWTSTRNRLHAKTGGVRAGSKGWRKQSYGSCRRLPELPWRNASDPCSLFFGQLLCESREQGCFQIRVEKIAVGDEGQYRFCPDEDKDRSQHAARGE